MLIDLLRKLLRLNRKKDLCPNKEDYFRFNDKILPYNRIPFNNSSERMVEVPIAFDFLYENLIENNKFLRPKFKILEVGNVLSNYENLLNAYLQLDRRDIIDKFEVGPKIKNIDLLDYHKHNEYDFIISISTVEHIGQLTDPSGKYGEEEVQRDREAPLKAIVKIYNILKKDGKALITVPFGKLTDLGWLIQFDKEYLNLLFEKYSLPKEEVSIHYLKRVSMSEWIECNEKDLIQTEFHYPFPYANGIAVIYMEKEKHREIEIKSHSTELSNSLEYHPPILIGNLYSNGLILTSPLGERGIIRVDEKTFIFYGPYLYLQAGMYELYLSIKVEGSGNFILDITSEMGYKVLWKTSFNQSIEIKHILCLTKEEKDVEVRLFNNHDNPVELTIENIYFRRRRN